MPILKGWRWHRQGQKYAQKLERLKTHTELLRAAGADALGDNGAELANMLLQLAMSESFQMLLDLDTSSQRVDPVKLMTAVSRLLSSATEIKQFRANFQAEVEARAAAAAADVEQTLRKNSGLSDERVAWIKAKILGVAEA